MGQSCCKSTQPQPNLSVEDMWDKTSSDSIEYNKEISNGQRVSPVGQRISPVDLGSQIHSLKTSTLPNLLQIVETQSKQGSEPDQVLKIAYSVGKSPKQTIFITSEDINSKLGLSSKFVFGRKDAGVGVDFLIPDGTFEDKQFDIKWDPETKSMLAGDYRGTSGLFVKVRNSKSLENGQIISFCGFCFKIKISQDNKLGLELLDKENRENRCYSPEQGTRVTIGKGKGNQVRISGDSVSQVQCE